MQMLARANRARSGSFLFRFTKRTGELPPGTEWTSTSETIAGKRVDERRAVSSLVKRRDQQRVQFLSH